MSLPRHIRLAGRNAIENKLAQIVAPSLGELKAQKTKQLGGKPDANIPKVVSFPTTS
ncbi:MAG TPA: hypothetical protein VIV09_02510 [Pseudolabrys sp.]